MASMIAATRTLATETAADADMSRTHEKPSGCPERRWRCAIDAGVTWRAPAAWHVRLGGASRSPGPTGETSQPCTTIHPGWVSVVICASIDITCSHCQSVGLLSS